MHSHHQKSCIKYMKVNNFGDNFFTTITKRIKYNFTLSFPTVFAGLLNETVHETRACGILQCKAVRVNKRNSNAAEKQSRSG